MTPEVIYHQKQIEALQYLSVESDKQQVLYGGAASGGKSFLGVDWQIKRRIKYPKTRGIIGRGELKKLQVSTMLTFWEHCVFLGLLPGKHFKYNGQLNVITWYNGSQTILMDLTDAPSDPQFTRFGSTEITDYFVDEGIEASEKALNILDSRVRYRLIGGKPKGLICSNPGKGFLYNEFFDADRNGRIRHDRAFVRALPTDNPHTDPVYLEKLARLPESDRKRLLEGDWDYDETKDRIFLYDDLLRIFSNEQKPGEMFTTADIAAMGDDFTIVGVWSGLTLVAVYKFKHKYPHEVAKEIRQINERHKVTLNNTVVDSDGLGIGVQGELRCCKFLNAGAAKHPQDYENQRSECYYKLADLVRTNTVACSVSEYKEQIVKELDCIRRKNMNSEKRLGIIPREDIIKLLGHSPDLASMIMMRMYFELNPNRGKYSYA